MNTLNICYCQGDPFDYSPISTVGVLTLHVDSTEMKHCYHFVFLLRLRLKRDGTRAETRFRLTAKRTSPFISAGASVQSTTGSRVVRISGSNCWIHHVPR